jgi:probable rRNA maturation factor
MVKDEVSRDTSALSKPNLSTTNDTTNDTPNANSMTNSVEVLDETGGYARATDLGDVLAHFMTELTLVEREVTLVFCDDVRIRELNAAHRGVDAATDVLSYPTSEPDDDWGDWAFTMPHLGDIIISIDTARSQATAAEHSLEQEILILAAHGLTHLLGHDHPTEDAWIIFNDHQKRILAHWHPAA